MSAPSSHISSGNKLTLVILVATAVSVRFDVQITEDVTNAEDPNGHAKAMINVDDHMKIQSVMQQDSWVNISAEAAPRQGVRGHKWPSKWRNKLGSEVTVLGSGSYGDVNLASVWCHGTDTKRKVAVKETQAGRDLQQAKLEANLLKKFSGGIPWLPYNARFPTYFDDAEEGGKVYIMMQAANKKSLRSIIDTTTPNTNTKVTLFFEMMEGISFMHSHFFVHRDLKPENVMLSYKNSVYKAMVGDLGAVCAMRMNHVSSNISALPMCDKLEQIEVGTPNYIAPEFSLSWIVDPANDIWAAGLILYELLHQELPSGFKPDAFKIDNDSKFKAMQAGLLKDLLKGMLEINYKKRLSADQVVNQGLNYLSGSEEDEVQEPLPC